MDAEQLLDAAWWAKEQARVQQAADRAWLEAQRVPQAQLQGFSAELGQYRVCDRNGSRNVDSHTNGALRPGPVLAGRGYATGMPVVPKQSEARLKRRTDNPSWAILYSLETDNTKEFWVKTDTYDVKVGERPLTGYQPVSFSLFLSLSANITDGSPGTSLVGTASASISFVPIGDTNLEVAGELSVSASFSIAVNPVTGGGAADGSVAQVDIVADGPFLINTSVSAAISSFTGAAVSAFIAATAAGEYGTGASAFPDDPTNNGSRSTEFMPIAAPLYDEAFIQRAGSQVFPLIRYGPASGYTRLIYGKLTSSNTSQVFRYSSPALPTPYDRDWRASIANYDEIASTSQPCLDAYIAVPDVSLNVARTKAWRIALPQLIDGQSLRNRLQNSVGNVAATLEMTPISESGTSCTTGTITERTIRLKAPGRGTIEAIAYSP